MQHHSLPFRSAFSFSPLIRSLEQKQHSNNLDGLIAQHLLQELKATPAFLEPVTQPYLLKQNPGLVERLFSYIFSPFAIQNEIGAAMPPFEMNAVFSTDKWKQVAEDAELNFSYKDSDHESALENKLVYINHLVLQEVYGWQNVISKNLICSIPDPVTKLNRYYKTDFNTDFIEIYPTIKPQELSEEVIKKLTDNPFDRALWEKHIPPKNFEFRGFLVLKLTDVTQSEVLSEVKYDLLKKNAIISRRHFSKVEQKIRELYNIPSLQVGIVSYNIDEHNQVQEEFGPTIWNSIIPKEQMPGHIGEQADHDSKEAFAECVYDRMIKSGRTQVIEDLQELPNPTAVEMLMMEKGIRSFIVAPLEYNGTCLGGVELACDIPNALSTSAAMLLEKILPIFAMSAKRSLEEMENRLQAFIKEQYTAVHPSVEWRFSQAALKQLGLLEKGQSPDFEPIVFDNVYPLFAQSDIRGSSTERTLSIQDDLIAQLSLARKTMRYILNRRPLHTMEELNFRIGNLIAEVKEGLNSGDETSVLMFLKNEVEPLFKHFEQTGLLSEKECAQYFERLDPALQMLYEKRKAFEESLTTINEAVSRLIDQQQEVAQKTFPHYFEKYKTDGVEYSIYVGDSISPSRHFDMIYLRELRLWQLKLTVQIAQMTKKLKKELPIPLETTHLILVNSAPISIRFREDEKQFDVDGAYNIRYEIVKKRIDKALIKNTAERLTQPDKIAIVYTQEQEAMEYRRYLGYLQHLGLIDEKVEKLELQDLQGVSGLKALRATVLSTSENGEAELSNADIQNLLEANTPNVEQS